MRSKHGYRWLLIILFLLAVSPLLIVPTGADPVPRQNLVVTGRMDVVSQHLKVAGNVTIMGGGRLILVNSTLEFVGAEPRHYFIVEAGGELVLNSSRVTGPERSYTIFVKHGSTFAAVNSTIENAGWKDHRDDGNYIWIGPAYTVDYSIYGHGLEINTTVKEFKGNALRNIASVRFYSSGNVVEDNIVVGMRHEGIAFIGSNDNVVRGNVFVDGSLNRETYGLKFYPGTRNQVVANNTFRNLCIGIFASLVPPWTAGVNFTISGNKMRHVIQGLVVKLRNSRIVGEDYRELWSLGIFIAASENVIVEGCRIENLTLYDESVASEEYFQEARPYIHPKYPRAYYNFLLLLRGGIMVSWSGRNITLRNNYIAYVPPYGYGVSFDVKYIVYDSKIVGNVFEHIGDVEPPWELSSPGLGSVSLNRLMFAPPGAAIELESTENLVIENNTFISCLNGILTSFPDAIGNYGNLTIRNNVLIGTYYAKWAEQGREKCWLGVGIGIGTAAYRPDENGERWRVFNSRAYIEICGNRVENFTYALVIDVRNQTLKKAMVEDNTFKGYLELVVPQYVYARGNKLAPLLPDLKISNLTVEATNNTATITVWIFYDLPVPFRKLITVEIAIDGEKVAKKLYVSKPGLYAVEHVAKLTLGEHVVEVRVDPANEIKEKDEDNNYVQKTFEVGRTEKETEPEKETEGKFLALLMSAVVILLVLSLLLYTFRRIEW